MDWIKYTDTARSYRVGAAVTSGGYLIFTQGAVARFKMAEFGFVVLYYSPTTKRIGIELVNSQEVEGARKLRLRGSSADLSIRPFLDKYGVRPAVTQRFDLTLDEASGFLVIDLTAGRARGSVENK